MCFTLQFKQKWSKRYSTIEGGNKTFNCYTGPRLITVIENEFYTS